MGANQVLVVRAAVKDHMAGGDDLTGSRIVGRFIAVQDVGGNEFRRDLELYRCPGSSPVRQLE